MTTAALLKAARQKIEKPENWTQGANARDKNGAECPLESKEACQFCALGAVSTVEDESSHLGYLWAEGALLRAVLQLQPDSPANPVTVIHFNDHGTHADVLKMFDLAIKETENVPA